MLSEQIADDLLQEMYEETFEFIKKNFIAKVISVITGKYVKPLYKNKFTESSYLEMRKAFIEMDARLNKL